MRSKLIAAVVGAVALAIGGPAALGSNAIPTHVDIDQQPPGAWMGTVSSRAHACERHREVVLHKLTGGVVGADTTNARGVWRISGGSKPGSTYYADAAAKRITGKSSVNCAYGSSDPVLADAR